jgi:hypothetical protein
VHYSIYILVGGVPGLSANHPSPMPQPNLRPPTIIQGTLVRFVQRTDELGQENASVATQFAISGIDHLAHEEMRPSADSTYLNRLPDTQFPTAWRDIDSVLCISDEPCSKEALSVACIANPRSTIKSPWRFKVDFVMSSGVSPCELWRRALTSADSNIIEGEDS